MNSRAARIGIPVLAGVLLLLGWQALVVANDINSPMSKPPSAAATIAT